MNEWNERMISFSEWRRCMCWCRRGFKIIDLAPSGRCRDLSPLTSMVQQQQAADKERCLTTNKFFVVEDAQRTTSTRRRRRRNSVACRHLANLTKLAPTWHALWRLVGELSPNYRRLLRRPMTVTMPRRRKARRSPRRFATSATSTGNQNPARCSSADDRRRRPPTTSTMVCQQCPTPADLTYFLQFRHFRLPLWPNPSRYRSTATHRSIRHQPPCGTGTH